MHDLYVRDVLKYCDGNLISGSKDKILGDIVTDSRVVTNDQVYVAIKGDRFDGNDYIDDAIDKGASIIIASRVDNNKDYNGVCVILVKNTIDCLQKLAMYKRSLYDIPVIAVTGSVGKTSTKDIIYSVVSKKYNALKTMGNYNNHLGVPLTILSLREHDALVIEMGMNHLGEISLLSKIAKPTIGVITNVGTAHIGNLGSRENILKAKLEILDGMIDKSIVINIDNDMLNSSVDKLKDNYDLYTVSINNDSMYKAVNIKEDIFSSKFDIIDKDNNILVNVGGQAFIYNSLVAYSIGDILGIDAHLIKEGISEFKLSSHRLEKKINNNGVIIIDDTYNANYDSMKSSIELLGKVKDKRKILIIGDMLELGDYSKEIHYNIGEVVFNNSIDVLITVGEESKHIVDKVLSMGFNKDNIYSFNNESEVSTDMLKQYNSNDIILLKGSHSIGLVNIVDRLMNI